MDFLIHASCFNSSEKIVQNRGEEISLRLRTDDLKGFRKYESIKKTLLHELVLMPAIMFAMRPECVVQLSNYPYG